MKIAIYGASGMIGSRVAAEAVSRGHEVVGITRSGGEQPAGVRAVVGSANDAAAVKEIASSVDVLVSAIGPSRTGGDPQEFLAAVDNLIAAADGARLVVVGGAGSLVANGKRLVDDPEFPEIYKAEALVQSTVLETLRATPAGVDWTLLSPAPVIAPGERTGAFKLGADEPVGGEISAEDYAVALLDELETPANRRRRFTLAY
ncbi:NAD(P)-dependent oxidoreductase [Kribbella sp. CA-293567]|uniref:NAD(P)-dependent oxidoreductase n=1 Tax=Kribbella sp. CA-293567 TaxID=3002436 RepID=UPI0022DDA85D|nr:NAD(P)H-binding protein [Kribbella sp. CA-293567]WBQ06924.1 NAD(P)H-binding protein [Kribbella sp. CA-293567]